jgi:predicted dehydrogenase
MTKNAVIKIGVIGLANIATRSLMPAIASMPEKFMLKGVASRNFLRATQIASEYSSQCYETYESLISDSNIDAVYIPLPNALHYKYVMMALESGKHVLVEKSLGCSYREVQNMIEYAKLKELILVENFQFRFHSQLAEILKILNRGVIGDLRSMRASFGFPPFPSSTNIRYSAELGGGALLDAGAYLLKIAPIFIGKDIHIAHASMAYDRERNIDIWGGGVLQQNNGPLFCQFAYGFDNYYQCSIELWGSLGKLVAKRIFTAPPGLQPKLIIEAQQDIQELSLPADNHFQKMLKHFHSLVNHETQAEEEYEQNIFQAKLIEDFKNAANYS